MLPTLSIRQSGLLPYTYNKWKSLYRHEDLGYMGAFLVQIRQSFRNLKGITETQEQEICQKLYKYFLITIEVN